MRPSCARPTSSSRRPRRGEGSSYNRDMEGRDVSDRQFEALLERLDTIALRLEQIDRRLEAQEGLILVSKELRSLEESLNALAYAALGQSPRVTRRAS
jgi:hypothetical protein